uniref:RBR-type E3 ubiquitin transferase n=1 Tax=Arcella intermedia TaxID=1963864 RepID=A0A6B2LFL4_9EUKA
MCPICFNDYPISNICVLDSCFHRFCKECIEEWIKTKVNDKEVTVITCPDNRCLKQITYNEVCSILTDKNLLAKYEKFTLEKSLETIPDLRWCPRPGCGNAMIGGKKTLMMRCTNPSCLFCFCFNCKEEWHADATCTQYQQWKKDNASGTDRAKLWIQQHTKACPSCHVAIEKNGGCNHMTCRGCHYEFCWICMGRYTSGHFGDAYSSGSCPQYS